MIDDFRVPTYEHVNAICKVKDRHKDSLIYVVDADNRDVASSLKSMRKACDKHARSILTTPDNTYVSVFKECIKNGIGRLNVYCDKTNLIEISNCAKEFDGFMSVNIIGIESSLHECANAMETAAIKEDLRSFTSGLNASTTTQEAIKLLKEVRASNGLSKKVSFRKHIEFDDYAILKSYKAGDVLKVNESLQHDGSSYTIIGRETNFIVCKNEFGITKKIFVKDVINKNV